MQNKGLLLITNSKNCNESLPAQENLNVRNDDGSVLR